MLRRTEEQDIRFHEHTGVDASANTSVDAKESKVIPEKKKKKTVKSKVELGVKQALPVCKSSSDPEVAKKECVQN